MLKNNSAKDKEWNLIIIHDAYICHGENFVKLLNLLKSSLDIHLCILDDDIEGYSKTVGFWDLVNENQGVLSISECTNFLSKVNLEWGNILLFKEFPQHWDLLSELDHFEKIYYTLATIRAADANYILVYTQEKDLHKEIEKSFHGVTVEFGPLTDLWYPE